MSNITNGVLKNGIKLGKAKVISTNLLTMGHMVLYIEFSPTSITVHETDLLNVEPEQF